MVRSIANGCRRLSAAYDLDPNLLWNMSSVFGVVVLAGFYVLNNRNAQADAPVAPAEIAQSSS